MTAHGTVFTVRPESAEARTTGPHPSIESRP